MFVTTLSFFDEGHRMDHAISGDTLADLSRAFSAVVRDTWWLGSSKVTGDNTVFSDGEPVGRVSYNGRIWPLGEWHEGQAPIYDNR